MATNILEHPQNYIYASPISCEKATDVSRRRQFPPCAHLLGPATATPRTVDDLKARSPWFGLVPNSVAEQQVAWERREAVTRMRHLGYTLNEIAKQWCTSPAMISYLLRHQANKSRAPIVKWLADETDVLVLAKLIRRTALEQLIDDSCTEVHSVVSVRRRSSLDE